MEPFWEEIRRCLIDSISELNRVLEEVRLLVKEHSPDSSEIPVYRLQNEGALPAALHRGGRIYSARAGDPGDDAMERNCASLVKEGEFWTVAWSRNTVRLRASKGVRLLAALIENPHRQFHVIDLERYERKDDSSEGDIPGGSSNAGPILDRRAQESYKAKLLDLRDELEEAERFNDIFRASKIRTEMSLLTKELSRAFGLHGESRLAISEAERARVRVTLAIKGAIGKISKYNSAVGWHLTTSTRTGFFCSYLPSPLANHSDDSEKIA
jgi:hypothetical protein